MSRCAAIPWSFVMPRCQYNTSPVSSADRSQSPEWFQVITLTARAQPCLTVSKLNVTPDQNVNTPEAAPVRARCPSGVQHTVLIEHCAALFRLWCIIRVHTADAGESAISQ
jgi:hypothetical protein